MFSENVKYIRIKKQISQEQLASILGYKSGAAVAQWELGKAVPPSHTLTRLANMVNVSVDTLLNHDITEPLKPTAQSTRLNVYASVHAGIPNDAIDEVVDFEEIPVDWTAGGREYFAVRVTGDCMSPDYLAGDTIIVLKTSACDTGDDCIVRIDGDSAILRRVMKSDSGAVILQPLNHAYNPIVFTGAPGEPTLAINGVVRELRRRR